MLIFEISFNGITLYLPVNDMSVKSWCDTLPQFHCALFPDDTEGSRQHATILFGSINIAIESGRENESKRSRMNALRPSRQLEVTNRRTNKTFSYLWFWMDN